MERRLDLQVSFHFQDQATRQIHRPAWPLGSTASSADSCQPSELPHYKKMKCFKIWNTKQQLMLCTIYLPKNMPVPIPAPMLSGISMPCLHFSASRRRSKQPVPMRGSWPKMMFSETPRRGSTSAWPAASSNTSTVSSKEHLIKAPVSYQAKVEKETVSNCNSHKIN